MSAKGVTLVHVHGLKVTPVIIMFLLYSLLHHCFLLLVNSVFTAPLNLGVAA